MISKKKKSLKSTNFWLLAIGAILLGVLTGICILFWYTPRAYNPVISDSTKQTSLYLTHDLGPEFFNQVQLCKPFELIITQSGLNDIIRQEFQSEEFGDASFSNPHVIFSDQSVILMGTLAYESVSSVLTIIAAPTMADSGKINLNIQSIRLGMVPVMALVTKLAQKVFDENRSCFEDDPIAEKNIQAIIHKEPFDPIFLFSAQHRQYQVRITDFFIEQGSLTLALSPKQL